MRLLVPTVCLVALAACGGGAGTDAGGATTPPATTPATTPATSAPEEPPVALTGKVSDRGTEDLGTATTLALDLGDFYFSPTYVTAAPGTQLTVTLTNVSETPHTFTVDSPKVDVTVEKGGTGTASFRTPASGTLAFYCKLHKAQGMQGGFAFS